jgi:hypothetical protein
MNWYLFVCGMRRCTTFSAAQKHFPSILTHNSSRLDNKGIFYRPLTPCELLYKLYICFLELRRVINSDKVILEIAPFSKFEFLINLLLISEVPPLVQVLERPTHNRKMRRSNLARDTRFITLFLEHIIMPYLWISLRWWRHGNALVFLQTIIVAMTRWSPWMGLTPTSSADKMLKIVYSFYWYLFLWE